MSIADKLTTVAENQEKVFEAGRTKEWSDFWDVFQRGGNRRAYNYGFYSRANPKESNQYHSWVDILYPKYDIIVYSAEYMFGNINTVDGSQIDLEERLNQCGVKLDLSGCSYSCYAFYYAKAFSVIPEIDMTNHTRASNSDYMFLYCTAKTIRKIILGSNTELSTSMFMQMTYLKDIAFEGEIISDVSFSSCYALTHDSLMNIINALKDYSEDTSGTVYKITLGSTNKAKLTDDELNMITNKGWTYA